MEPIAPSKRSDRPYQLAIMLSGRGSNFRAVFEHLRTRSLPAEIALVISDRNDAAGLSFAAESGLSTALIERRAQERSSESFDDEIIATLERVDPDLIVLAGFMRVLGPRLIAAFPDRIVNIHPSLLPSFRGLHAQRQALDAGVKLAGCTVHLVAEEVDAGAILAQAAVPVLPGDDEKRLSERILREEHRILPWVVERFVRSEVWRAAGGPLIVGLEERSDVELKDS